MDFELLMEGIQLMLLGMAVVFFLLSMIVLAIKTMSRFVSPLSQSAAEEISTHVGALETINDPHPLASNSSLNTEIQASSLSSSSVGLSESRGQPLASPLTGSVFEVLVAEGQEVQIGDVVVILEAMKMENEVRSDRSGQVTAIVVQEGSLIRVGKPILYIS